jgi:hypothetical protein
LFQELLVAFAAVSMEDNVGGGRVAVELFLVVVVLFMPPAVVVELC